MFCITAYLILNSNFSLSCKSDILIEFLVPYKHFNTMWNDFAQYNVLTIQNFKHYLFRIVFSHYDQFNVREVDACSEGFSGPISTHVGQGLVTHYEKFQI